MYAFIFVLVNLHMSHGRQQRRRCRVHVEYRKQYDALCLLILTRELAGDWQFIALRKADRPLLQSRCASFTTSLG